MRKARTDEKGYVYAAAELRACGGQFLWIIQRCPFCKQQHQHGGGTIGEDPRDHLFHRVSHCVQVAPAIRAAVQAIGFHDGGYVLVDADSSRTREILEHRATARTPARGAQ